MMTEVDRTKLSSVLSLLELRIETEAAALAAQRCSPDQEEAMMATLANLRAEVRAGNNAVEADFAFHRSSVAASGNSRFVDMMTMFGADLIPRSRVGGAINADPEYLAALDAEHFAILRAIQNRDPEKARRAMRNQPRTLSMPMAKAMKFSASPPWSGGWPALETCRQSDPEESGASGVPRSEGDRTPGTETFDHGPDDGPLN